jgi:hypothetical protein
VLALLAVLLLAMVLITPTPPEQRGALSSYSAAAGGARGLHDAVRRLGWRVERRIAPFTGALDSTAVYAVLEPSVALTSGEAHRLLDAVRAGAGLLLVVQRGSALSDSLGLRRSTRGGTLPLAARGFCPDSLNRQGLVTWPDGRVHSWWLTRHPAGAVPFAHVSPDAGLPEASDADEDADEAADDADADSAGRRPAAPRPVRRQAERPVTRAPGAPDARSAPLPADSIKARLAGGVPDGAESEGKAGWRPAVVGLPLGRGRVVAVADPDLLRNDVLRVCRWNAGVLAVRALEWLGEPAGRRLVFDEYHHGYGSHADPLGATGRALVRTPPGRLALQLAAAGLVLLAAAGIRPVAPAARRPIERRSPLEHVGALARAYEQVGATRLAARRLVRGLRRRHGVGAQRLGGEGAGGADADASFLRQTAARRPALAEDVRRLERALAEGAREDLAAVGEAAARIDRHLRPDPNLPR